MELRFWPVDGSHCDKDDVNLLMSLLAARGAYEPPSDIRYSFVNGAVILGDISKNRLRSLGEQLWEQASADVRMQFLATRITVVTTTAGEALYQMLEQHDLAEIPPEPLLCAITSLAEFRHNFSVTVSLMAMAARGVAPENALRPKHRYQMRVVYADYDLEKQQLEKLVADILPKHSGQFIIPDPVKPLTNTSRERIVAYLLNPLLTGIGPFPELIDESDWVLLVSHLLECASPIRVLKAIIDETRRFLEERVTNVADTQNHDSGGR